MNKKAIKFKLLRFKKGDKKGYFSFKVYFNDILRFCLLITIIVGAFLRFYNLVWDEGFVQHPDEKKIVINTINIDFPYELEPTYYTYNGFPMYLNRAVAESVAEITDNTDWLDNWGEVTKIVRTVSAIISTITLPLLYILFRKFFGSVISLIGMAIAAFNVGFIQHAHFGTAETLLIFFLVLISIFSLKLFKDPLNNKLYFLLAVCSGLSIATKTSGIAFLVIPLVTFQLLFLKNKQKKEIIFQSFIFLVITFLVFFVASPYSLINFQDFWGSMKYEKDIVDLAIDVPWNIQFIDRSPLLAISNLFWLNTFLLAISGILGLLVKWLEIVKTRNLSKFIPISIFVISYFIYILSWDVKFIRYYLFLTPFIIIGFLFLITKIKLLRLQWVTIIIVLSVSIVWGIAFSNIYKKEYTRISASKWIYENVEERSVVMTEIFDEGLPLRLPDYGGEYDFVSIGMYNEDSIKKTYKLTKYLEMSDYVVISSERFYKTIGRLNRDFPMSSRYYDKMLNEELGYELAASFVVKPEIFGISINDYSAEETLRTFDHPRVFIFKNVSNLKQKEIYNLINEPIIW